MAGGTTIVPDRRGLWRALAILPLFPLLAVWAVWRDVYTLGKDALERTGSAQAVVEWALVSFATFAMAALLWSKSRSLRVLGYTFHALVLSIGLGMAAVIAVVHAFGGPQGDRNAPVSILAGLGVVVALGGVALLATAGLMVEDIKAAGEEDHTSAAE